MQDIEGSLFKIVNAEIKVVYHPNFAHDLDRITRWLAIDHSDKISLCKSIHEMIKDRNLANFAKNAEKVELCEFVAKILMNYVVKVIFLVSVPFGIKYEFLTKFMKHCASITNITSDGKFSISDKTIGDIIGPNNKIIEDSLKCQLEIFGR